MNCKKCGHSAEDHYSDQGIGKCWHGSGDGNTCSCPQYNVSGITRAEFQAFVEDLVAKDKLFHFEDDPAEIINIKTGERTFTDEEAAEVAAVLKEAFASDFDPFECWERNDTENSE